MSDDVKQWWLSIGIFLFSLFMTIFFGLNWGIAVNTDINSWMFQYHAVVHLFIAIPMTIISGIVCVLSFFTWLDMPRVEF